MTATIYHSSVHIFSRVYISNLLLSCAGLTPDGLSLFERYIDVTYDLQTVAVVLVQSLPCSQLTADNRVKQWIQEYRDLLDRWSLWKERFVSLNVTLVTLSCILWTSSLTFNVTRMQFVKDKPGQRPLYRTEAVLDSSEMSNDIWLYDSLVYFHWLDGLPDAEEEHPDS